MEPPTIECQVCHRSAGGPLPFNCITCAQNLLYEPRLELARSLLTKEALAEEIEQAVQEASHPTKISRIEDPTARRIAYDNARSATAKSKQRTKDIMTDVEALRQELEEKRAYIKKQRSLLSTRRATYESAAENLKRQQALLQKETKDIVEFEGKLDSLRDQTAGVRTFLCKETAALYGLQPKRRRRSTTGRETYLLGGSSVIDLRDLHTASPTHVTASIARVAHLVHLTAHYLGLRLPAEITLPCADHPYPVIRSPLSSYKTPMLVNNSSYAKSQSSTRIRPLRLEKTLPTLAQDDPVAYGSFIDAITLLAWTIAWIGRTQGKEFDSKSWEDICAMGRNLYLLFSSPSESAIPPIPSRTASSISTRTRTSDTGTSVPTTTIPEKPTPSAKPGYYSHNTTRSFLPSAKDGDAMEYMRNWYFASPARLIDRIKSALASERMGAEWEMLEKDEWEVDGGEVGEGVKTDGGTEVGKGNEASRGITGGVGSGRSLTVAPPTATVTAGRPSRLSRMVTPNSPITGLRGVPGDDRGR